MNDPDKISPDDPRLTAYALGELEGADFAQVDALVRAEPALQAAVAELRAFGEKLASTLAAEPAPDFAARTTDDGRQTSDLSILNSQPSTLIPRPPRKRLARLIPFPLYALATAAAACLAVLLWLKVDAFAPKPKEVALAPTAEGAAQMPQIVMAMPVNGVPPTSATGMMDAPAPLADALPGTAAAPKFATTYGPSTGSAPAQVDASLAQPRAQQLVGAGYLAADKNHTRVSRDAGTLEARSSAATATTFTKASAAAQSDIHFGGDYHPPTYEAFLTSRLLVNTISYNAVRIAEPVNASTCFPCPPPTSGDAPFASHLEVASVDLIESPPLPSPPPAPAQK